MTFRQSVTIQEECYTHQLRNDCYYSCCGVIHEWISSSWHCSSSILQYWTYTCIRRFKEYKHFLMIHKYLWHYLLVGDDTFPLLFFNYIYWNILMQRLPMTFSVMSLDNAVIFLQAIIHICSNIWQKHLIQLLWTVNSLTLWHCGIFELISESVLSHSQKVNGETCTKEHLSSTIHCSFERPSASEGFVYK